jgi:glucose-1-phosphate cytidylyltransferase
MKVVILCGGKGTRMGSHLNDVPKVLYRIGDRPILWHIMKGFQSQGFREFILCLGYRGGAVQGYFATGTQMPEPGSTPDGRAVQIEDPAEDWQITFLETGESTNTGGRLSQAAPFITDDHFMATYGDGLANVNLKELVAFHLQHRRLSTITAVRPHSQFGLLSISSDGRVQRFREKPVLRSWINGGYFVFSRRVLPYLQGDPVLEREPFVCLAGSDQMVAFRHNGFWACMDTYKDFQALNDLWNGGSAEWKTWA